MQGALKGHMGVLRIAAALSLAFWSSRANAYDVAAAARAFQEGQKAQLSGEFARAAELFELADELAPTPEALRSAIRNHEAAGHPARAATFALAAQTRYPNDARTLAISNAVIARATPALARLTVRCDTPCALLIDGEALTVDAVASADAFVPPGQRVIEARFGTEQRATETVELLAGEARAIELHEPVLPEIELPAAEPAPQPRPEPAVVRAPPPPAIVRAPAPRIAEDDDGLPSWLFLTASALAVTGATVAIVSGADALDKRDAYHADPTRERYEQGVDSERRTNALLIATAGLAATSAVLLAFTDWDAGDERPARAATTLSLSPFPPNLVLRSSLP